MCYNVYVEIGDNINKQQVSNPSLYHIVPCLSIAKRHKKNIILGLDKVAPMCYNGMRGDSGRAKNISCDWTNS